MRKLRGQLSLFLKNMIKNCLNCHKEFRTTEYRIKTGHGKFCSKICKNQSLIGKGIKNAHKFVKGHATWNKGKKYEAIREKRHYRYKGGYWIDPEGYKIIELKRLGERYRIPEHRLVMEQYLNRKLLQKEHIHHIDGNKLNNNIENLIILSPQEHAYLHFVIKGGGVNFTSS